MCIFCGEQGGRHSQRVQASDDAAGRAAPDITGKAVLALIPKRLELPVSRGAGGHYSGAVVIPDVRRPHREGDGQRRMQAT